MKYEIEYENIRIKAVNIPLSITVLFIWIAHFLVDFMIGIWPVYKTMAHLDLAKAGFISGICAFIGEGLQIAFGPLSDRGYRKLLIICGLLATAACSMVSYTTDYILLFLLFLSVCVGSGAFHPSAVGLIGSLTLEKKGLLIGIFASGGALGMASSQLIFSNSHSFFEGNTIFLVIPTVLLVLSLLFYPLHGAENSNRKMVQRINLKAFAELFRRRDLSALYFTQICNSSILWGFIFLLPDILLSRGHANWVCFGGGHMCLILGSAIMMVPAGYLADKYSSKSVLINATIAGAILLYLFYFLSETSPAVIFAILFMLGGVIGVCNPIAIALGNRLSPESPGMISAFLMGMVWCVAEGVGQFGGGLLTKLFVEDAPAKALACLGVLFFIGLAFCQRLPDNIALKVPSDA